MEGVIVILLSAIFVIFLLWNVSDTRGKRSMLNSIGLDFSESKIKKVYIPIKSKERKLKLSVRRIGYIKRNTQQKKHIGSQFVKF